MIVVSDTSALANLAIVDHLWLLESIYQTVIIPDVVARELAAASNPIIPAILQAGCIQPQPLTNSELVNQLQQERGLDAGEANAIALALELQADDLLIDERLGRHPQVQPVMDALISQAGFRVSSQLYQRVLALAQEP